jgi:hypothetical protein
MRVIVTTPLAAVNTLDILAQYLTMHTPTKADRGSLVNAAIDEYIRAHGTLVQTAVTWWRKGKKEPRQQA